MMGAWRGRFEENWKVGYLRVLYRVGLGPRVFDGAENGFTGTNMMGSWRGRCNNFRNIAKREVGWGWVGT